MTLDPQEGAGGRTQKSKEKPIWHRNPQHTHTMKPCPKCGLTLTCLCGAFVPQSRGGAPVVRHFPDAHDTERDYALTKPAPALSSQPEPWLDTPSDKRKRLEQELACFTPQQQRAIATICGQWWESRLEAIDVGEVEELRDKLDFVMEQTGIRPTQAQIAIWKGKRNRQLAGPRG